MPKTYPLVYVDRSRIQAYLDCKRFRYLRYHYPDELGKRKGIQPVEKAVPLLNGSFIHKAIELHLTGLDVDAAIDYAKGAYLRETGLSPERAEEQLCLLEGLVRAWVKFRLPQILAEYEVVSVEEELQWPLDCQIIDMVKCDVILRRRADGLLFILEFKTTKDAGFWWQGQWKHNTQVLANTQAIQEMLGEPVAGMLIEGLVKGAYRKDTAKSSPFFGKHIQDSILCYAYKYVEDGEVNYTLTYGSTREKVQLWKEMTPAEWVNNLSVDELSSLFCPLPPIKPNPLDLQRWRRQTLYQEKGVAADLALLDQAWWAEDYELYDQLLDERFPKNDANCFRYYGNPCPYEPLCFTGEVERDPLGSGLYVWRTPHHKEPEEGS